MSLRREASQRGRSMKRSGRVAACAMDMAVAKRLATPLQIVGSVSVRIYAQFAVSLHVEDRVAGVTASQACMCAGQRLTFRDAEHAGTRFRA